MSFFSSVLEDCMKIKKTRLITFNTNFQLNRLDKNLQKTCDLSLTFNACQKYLTPRKPFQFLHSKMCKEAKIYMINPTTFVTYLKLTLKRFPKIHPMTNF